MESSSVLQVFMVHSVFLLIWFIINEKESGGEMHSMRKKDENESA